MLALLRKDVGRRLAKNWAASARLLATTGYGERCSFYCCSNFFLGRSGTGGVRANEPQHCHAQAIVYKVIGQSVIGARRCLSHPSLSCSSAHADPPEDDDAEAGVSELAAWPPPQDAQDSRLRRSLGAERREQQHAAQRAAQHERLVATEQARSSAAAPAQAPAARTGAAVPAASTGPGEAAAISGPASQPAGTPQHGLPALPGREAQDDAASSAACDEAPHLARDGGELNRTVGRMMLARTVRMGLSPITRRRTLAELRVRVIFLHAEHLICLQLLAVQRRCDVVARQPPNKS